jgi:hypothetical protein
MQLLRSHPHHELDLGRSDRTLKKTVSVDRQLRYKRIALEKAKERILALPRCRIWWYRIRVGNLKRVQEGLYSIVDVTTASYDRARRFRSQKRDLEFSD